jgi:hypothetical protein
MSTSNLPFKNIKFVLDDSIISNLKSAEERRRAAFVKNTTSSNQGGGGDQGDGGDQGGGGDQANKVPLNLPPGAAGDEAAMKAAGDAYFRVNGGETSKCSRYTYHIAYYYLQTLKTKQSPSGKYTGGHGNANDKEYRDNLVKLGYKMTPLGILSKKDLLSTIANIKTVGTIINYRSTIKAGGSNYNYYYYGHTQIYTNGVLATSKGTKWASSWGWNYYKNMVYSSIESDKWESYLFTL